MPSITDTSTYSWGVWSNVVNNQIDTYATNYSYNYTNYIIDGWFKIFSGKRQETKLGNIFD